MLAVFVIGSLGFAYAYMAHERITLINSDFFSFARRMDILGSAPWQQTWVDGLYPLGYPYLIKALSGLVGGYAPAARLLSVLSAIVALASLWTVAYRLGGIFVALSTVVFTGLNYWFLTFATCEGTDMPALALMLAALAIASSPKETPLRLLLLGSVLGAAYLIRYTALLALPALTLVWAWEDQLRWKPLLKKLFWVGLAFAAITAPQWIASWIVRGSPLYNTQHWNVWYAIEGEGKWWRILTVGAALPNLSAVIAKVGLYAFCKNFLVNLYRLSFYNMFAYPGYPLWIVGAGMVLGRRERIGIQLLGIGVVFGLAISLAFLSARVLLLLLPIQVCLSVLPIAWASKRWPFLARHVLYPTMAVALLAFGWRTYEFTLSIIHTPYEAAQRKLTPTLRRAGMQRVEQVLSFSHNLYDVDSPICERFATSWLGSSIPIRSEAEVLWLMVHEHRRFVVFDRLSPQDVPGLDNWYRHQRLAPPLRRILYEDTVAAYALPDSVQAAFHLATGADWSSFAQAQYPRLAKLWPSDASILQEEKPAPDSLLGTPTPELLSDWRRYKGERRLR